MLSSRLPAARELRPIDIHVGKRVAMLRSSAGKTVGVLASLMGCSTEHLEKIEIGEDRLASFELQGLSAALNVQSGFFYAD
jgi:transcriptional regulator with XRE-family HTH domain